MPATVPIARPLAAASSASFQHRLITAALKQLKLEEGQETRRWMTIFYKGQAVAQVIEERAVLFALAGQPVGNLQHIEGISHLVEIRAQGAKRLDEITGVNEGQAAVSAIAEA
jgi:hypothetical protein